MRFVVVVIALLIGGVLIGEGGMAFAMDPHVEGEVLANLYRVNQPDTAGFGNRVKLVTKLRYELRLDGSVFLFSSRNEEPEVSLGRVMSLGKSMLTGLKKWRATLAMDTKREVSELSKISFPWMLSENSLGIVLTCREPSLELHLHFKDRPETLAYFGFPCPQVDQFIHPSLLDGSGLLSTEGHTLLELVRYFFHFDSLRQFLDHYALNGGVR